MTAGRRYSLLLLTLLFFSWWSVYTRYVDLIRFDVATSQTFGDLSLRWYHETIAGHRAFPYQWRVLAFWIVWAVERLTHLDPHLIDVALKTVALTASSVIFYLFSVTVVDEAAALLATALYLLTTAAAFASEGYAIYFSNDYLLVAGWFLGVYAVRRRWWIVAALATFVTAWAKETAVLIVILIALEALRGRAPWWAAVACAAALAIPTAILRTVYPAPLRDWAWWDTVRLNVPFLVRTVDGFATVIRNNLKVLLFLHVCWGLAYAGYRRTRDPLLASLAVTLVCYVCMAWIVVYIRELRHSLPFTILVLPLAAGEILALVKAPVRTSSVR